MLRVVHIRNEKRSGKHGILQTYSIVFVAMLLNQQTDHQESIVISHLKYIAYRNKSLPILESRVCASVTTCEFRGGRNGVWVDFSLGFSCHKFHTTISPQPSH